MWSDRASLVDADPTSRTGASVMRVFVSAYSGEGLPELRAALAQAAAVGEDPTGSTCTLAALPPADGRGRACTWPLKRPPLH